MRTDDAGTRARQAALVNMRQQLLAPASALVGYSEILHQEARRTGIEEMLPDLERILSAARDLSGMVDRLLDEAESRALFNTDDLDSVERTFRHDLRTPINGIKGYGEMLLEDLEELAAEPMRPDFEKLLSQANQLLADLNRIVRFSRDGGESAVENIEQDVVMASTDLVHSIRPVDESTLGDETGRILVVDDIESNRDLLSRRLTRDGHHVAVAADGKEALAMLGEGEFDLVLLDLMMPRMNGYEVLKHMKADAELRNIPVIMISALDETDSVIRCIEAGADDYLLKPFNPVLLKARLKSGLENKQWSDDERRRRRFIRQAFSRFISPTVVDQLVDDPSRLSLGGERLDITCVFTDLEGFTGLIESSEPTEVLPVLNRYLDGMCQIVLEHDGTIDKIVGDALHVFFGAPLPRPDHAQCAIRCVLALDAYARNFVVDEAARKLNFGGTRIGAHTGVAVVGNFGGESFFDYTAHGDVINTTARMESVNKHIGTAICVSAATASRCPDMPFRPIGRLLLKGKSQSVDAFEPLSAEQAVLASVQTYHDAFELLVHEDPAARDVFDQLRREYPADRLIAFHAERLDKGQSGTLLTFDEK
ncbi:MAG: response regulator [Gammaproteobacteria bacterium]